MVGSGIVVGFIIRLSHSWDSFFLLSLYHFSTLLIEEK